MLVFKGPSNSVYMKQDNKFVVDLLNSVILSSLYPGNGVCYACHQKTILLNPTIQTGMLPNQCKKQCKSGERHVTLFILISRYMGIL